MALYPKIENNSIIDGNIYKFENYVKINDVYYLDISEKNLFDNTIYSYKNTNSLKDIDISDIKKNDLILYEYRGYQKKFPVYGNSYDSLIKEIKEETGIKDSHFLFKNANINFYKIINPILKKIILKDLQNSLLIDKISLNNRNSRIKGSILPKNYIEKYKIINSKLVTNFIINNYSKEIKSILSEKKIIDKIKYGENSKIILNNFNHYDNILKNYLINNISKDYDVSKKDILIYLDKKENNENPEIFNLNQKKINIGLNYEFLDTNFLYLSLFNFYIRKYYIEKSIELKKDIINDYFSKDKEKYQKIQYGRITDFSNYPDIDFKDINKNTYNYRDDCWWRKSKQLKNYNNIYSNSILFNSIGYSNRNNNIIHHYMVKESEKYKKIIVDFVYSDINIDILCSDKIYDINSNYVKDIDYFSMMLETCNNKEIDDFIMFVDNKYAELIDILLSDFLSFEKNTEISNSQLTKIQKNISYKNISDTLVIGINPILLKILNMKNGIKDNRGSNFLNKEDITFSKHPNRNKKNDYNIYYKQKELNTIKKNKLNKVNYKKIKT